MSPARFSLHLRRHSMSYTDGLAHSCTPFRTIDSHYLSRSAYYIIHIDDSEVCLEEASIPLQSLRAEAINLIAKIISKCSPGRYLAQKLT
ncbi:hypothetical protein Mapa_008305 [Marchantia paleacea]|nr:hypothetical protein Mapa_008305 [Marchantia paleacea]